MQQGPLDVGRVSFGIHVWLRPQRLLRATELKSVHASFFFSAQARFDPASLCTATRNPSPSRKQHPCFTRTAVSPAPTMKSGGGTGGRGKARSASYRPASPGTAIQPPSRPVSSHIFTTLKLHFYSHILFHYIGAKVKMWSKNVDMFQEGSFSNPSLLKRVYIFTPHFYLTINAMV